MGKEHLGRHISIMYRYMNCSISKRLEKFNISFCNAHYLLALYCKDGVSQEELKKYINKDKGTAARGLKKLEDNGYIIRKRNEKDKREHLVFLTEKGLAIKDDIYGILEENRDISEDGISEEEREITLKVLKKMVNNYKVNEKNER